MKNVQHDTAIAKPAPDPEAWAPEDKQAESAMTPNDDSSVREDALSLLDEAGRRTLLRTMALAVDDIDNAPTLAQAFGIPETLLLDALSTNDGYAAATVELQNMRDRGELLRHKALRALDTGVSRLQRALEDNTVAPGTVAKLTNELFKMTGLAEERASKLRRDEGNQSPTVYFGVYASEDDIPPAPPGALEFNLIMPGITGDKAALLQGKIIEHGEATDAA